ncbi:acetoacetate decarboxylase family protein [Myxococcota bacterium]|nr:acetoacetate decarboxylase family protein [Myxococcota bacterium]
MTPKPPVRNQPLFTDGRGLNMAMQISPPFDFDGATLRAFPLRASIYTLQKLVDAYLNVGPPEVARFRVFMPYVYMMVVNYGRTSVTAANMGWLAQREVTFSIPLEQYRAENGRWVFQDFAYVSPFIYVENELSMTTGREVYGWPKSMVWLDEELPPWMDDPRARPKLATVKAMMFPEVYRGLKQEPRTFIEIEGAPPLAPLNVPPDARSPFAPWNAWTKLMTGSTAVLGDMVQLLSGLGVLRRQPGADAENARRMRDLVTRNFDPRAPNLYFNTVNLKQFRSADGPNYLAYQGLTSTKMVVKDFKRGGMLGTPEMMLGDSTGSLRVRIHRYAAQPIVESLGLEVAHEHMGDGVKVATLEPVYPFWLELDMTYNLGETLCWRTKTAPWTVGTGPDAVRYPDPPRDPGDPIKYPLYNTTTGASTMEVGGPFSFPNATLRVLPILADPDKLRKFLDDYLNVPMKGREWTFEPWGRYVYVVATNYEGMASGSNNIGWWADRDLVFYVPVCWYEGRDPADRRLRSVALVPAYSYANSTTAAITGSEVSGIPMLKVSLDSPPDHWMRDAGLSAHAKQSFLQMTSSVLPALLEGQGIEKRLLLEIRDGLPLADRDDTTWRHIADDWGRTLKQELARLRATPDDAIEAGRLLALEVLASSAPINILTLKQFREAGDPLAACYQSLVLVRRYIDAIDDLQEIEDDLHVRIDEYPGQPIVDALGLVPKWTDESGVMRSHYFDVIRPFWMKVSMREDLGVTLARRAGSDAWEDDPDTLANPPRSYFLEGTPQVGAPLGDAIDRGAPRRLKAAADAWRDAGGRAPMTREQASLVARTIEPQLVVASVLSREWENWGHPRWVARRQEIEREIGEHTAAALPWHLPKIELQCFETLIEKLDAAPYPLAGLKRHAEDLVAKMRTSVEALYAMEQFHHRMHAQLDTVAQKLVASGGVRAEEVEAVLDLDTLDDHLAQGLADAGVVVRGLAAGGPVRDVLPGGAHGALELLRAPKKKARALLELARDPKETSVSPEKIREVTQHSVERARSEYRALRDQLLTTLARAAQKPDHVIPRCCLPVPARDHTFPVDHSWDLEWYVGVRSNRPSIVQVSAV